MKLEEYRNWGDERLKATINGAFEAAMERQGDDRRILLVEAEFYVNELERRENGRAESERDRRESHRWRIDLFLELLIVVLIGFELWLGGCEGARQLTALGNLQQSAEATSIIMGKMVTALDKVNDRLQNELNLYYEPSLFLSYDPNEQYKLQIHNYSRTSIQIFGAKAGHMTCPFKEPVTISSGSYNPIEYAFIYIGVIDLVIGSDAKMPLVVYFKTEDGKEWQHWTTVERKSLAKGKDIMLTDQRSEQISWSRELTRRSAPVGKCPD